MDPGDLTDFAPRVEDGFGWLWVRGIGNIETAFIGTAILPIWPVQSMLVIKTPNGPMMRTLPRLSLRSVALAYLRPLLGAALVFGLLASVVALAGDMGPIPAWMWLSTLLVAVGFGACVWPLGVVPHRRARAMAETLQLPGHEVDRAFGVISEAAYEAAETEWRAARHKSSVAQQNSYQEGLAAQRARKAAKKAARKQAK